jgi:transposase
MTNGRPSGPAAVNTSQQSGVADAAGRKFGEVWPDLDPEWMRHFQRVVESGEQARFEAAAAGRWFDVFVSRIGGSGSMRIGVMFTDVSARRNAQDELSRTKDDLEHRVLDSIRAIGVDEIQYAKGHKYLTLVYQIDDLTRLLWVGKERTVDTFEGFFTMIGDELASQIEFVCSDMWKPYLRVIREHCSQALHVLDRFHIVAKMNEALDDVRASEARKMFAAGHEPLLKKTRWCLLKRKRNLTSTQRFRLRDLLRYNLATVRAYLLKEDFQQFWDYASPAWAGKFLDDWCRQTMRSRIEPMKKIAKMLRAHRHLILNYFKAKKVISSGVVEGLNNKAKVTMRKSYGFRTFRCLELALYHSLGKLPEPESTHDFF